jgi:hypothetical protein
VNVVGEPLDHPRRAPGRGPGGRRGQDEQQNGQQRVTMSHRFSTRGAPRSPVRWQPGAVGPTSRRQLRVPCPG